MLVELLGEQSSEPGCPLRNGTWPRRLSTRVFGRESPRYFLRGNYSVSAAQKEQLSRLEQLPAEVLGHVANGLDIESLMCVADASRFTRDFVQSLLDLIRREEALAAAWLTFLSVDTAKHFTLNDFLLAAASPTCATCQDGTAFGAFINLLTCSRICCKCLREPFRIPIPCLVALNAFHIDETDFQAAGNVMAWLTTHYREDRYGRRTSWGGLDFETRTCEKRALSLEAVMAAVQSKYSLIAETGSTERDWTDPDRCAQMTETRSCSRDWKDLALEDIAEYNRRVGSEYNWIMWSGSNAYTKTDALERAILIAAGKIWRISMDSPSFSSAIAVPLLEGNTVIKPLACKGCFRNVMYEYTSSRAKWDVVYTPSQLINHVNQTCVSAQQIITGEKLSYDDERKVALDGKVMQWKLWPDGHYANIPSWVQDLVDDLDNTDRSAADFRARCDEIVRLLKIEEAQRGLVSEEEPGPSDDRDDQSHKNDDAPRKPPKSKQAKRNLMERQRKQRRLQETKAKKEEEERQEQSRTRPRTRGTRFPMDQQRGLPKL